MGWLRPTPGTSRPPDCHTSPAQPTSSASSWESDPQPSRRSRLAECRISGNGHREHKLKQHHHTHTPIVGVSHNQFHQEKIRVFKKSRHPLAPRVSNHHMEQKLYPCLPHPHHTNPKSHPPTTSQYYQIPSNPSSPPSPYYLQIAPNPSPLNTPQIPSFPYPSHHHSVTLIKLAWTLAARDTDSSLAAFMPCSI